MYEKEMFNLERDICNFINENNIHVDIYISGSVSRNEERIRQEEMLSDIDIIIIYDHMSKRAQIEKAFESFKLNERIFLDIHFCFCALNNFICSQLTDYVLSINFDRPVIKKMNYIYENAGSLTLSPNRWIYQMQAVLFYFCKYKITSNEINLCKSFLCMMKLYIYKKGFIKTNEYIKDRDIGRYLKHLDVSEILYGDNLSYLFEDKKYSKTAKDQTITYLCYHIMDLLCSNNYDIFSVLKSVSYFKEIIMELGLYDLMSNHFKRYMTEVIIENTGSYDCSCISYNKK